MVKSLASLLFLALGLSAMASTSYMRREEPTSNAEMDQETVSLPDERLLAADIASGGVVTKLSAEREKERAKEAAVAASKSAYMASYEATQALLEKAHKTDVYDQDGFEVVQVPLKERLQEMQDASQKEADREKQILKDEKEKLQKRAKILREGGVGAQLLQTKEQEAAKKARESTYSGNTAIVSGFWADDRPNEERIDPDNMKIYTWKTYKHRFPFTHSWQLEVEWKKLPLAPKKVHKVSKRSEGGISGVLLEEGMTLVDEQQRELVWTKDINGHYHMGREIPTPQQIYDVAHPREAEMRKKMKKVKAENEKYGLWHNYTDQLAEAKQKLSSSKRIDQEDGVRSLEMMLTDFQDNLKIKPPTTGKAMVSVAGATGHVTSFNADISKVTALAVKRRIENVTGIPWEAQRLFIKGQELEDTSTLNKHVGGGRGVWIDMQTKGWDVTKNALIKRGKLPQPTAAPQNRITAASLEQSKVKPSTKTAVKAAAKAATKPTAKVTAPAKAMTKVAVKPKKVVSKTAVKRAAKAASKRMAKHTAKKEAASLAQAKQPEEVRQLASDVAGDEALNGASDELDNSDEALNAAAQEGDQEGFNGMFDDVDTKAKAHEMEQLSDTKTQEKLYAEEASHILEDRQKNAELRAKREKDAKEAALRPKAEEEPKSKAIVTRQVVYVRGDDGAWHVEKEEIATPGHPITNKEAFDTGMDEGIPVQDRISELQDSTDDGSDDQKELRSEDSDSDALLQADKDGKRPSHLHFDRKAFMKFTKHALSEEMKWRNINKAKEQANQAAAEAAEKVAEAKKAAAAKKVKSSLVEKPHKLNAKYQKDLDDALAKEQAWQENNRKKEAEEREAEARRKAAGGGSPETYYDEAKQEYVPLEWKTSTAPPPSKTNEEDVASPDSFLQVGSSSTPAGADDKKMKEATLSEASAQKVLYVLNKESKAQERESQARMEMAESSRKWRQAAHPDDYEGKPDPMSMTELSKQRQKKEKAYDGMQPVESGFWADDRPDERRVDMNDHKVYTWRQYRLKYPYKHSWTVEDMWKKLPTEKRVKKLGKKAFIQRFR